MDFHTAQRLFSQIEQTQLETLKQDLLQKAVRYARMRTDWFFMNNEERKAIDATRTAAHDAFIDACNILSRNMGKNHEDNNWRAELPDDRKVIGDFACHLHALLGILSR